MFVVESDIRLAFEAALKNDNFDNAVHKVAKSYHLEAEKTEIGEYFLLSCGEPVVRITDENGPEPIHENLKEVLALLLPEEWGNEVVFIDTTLQRLERFWERANEIINEEIGFLAFDVDMYIYLPMPSTKMIDTLSAAYFTLPVVVHLPKNFKDSSKVGRHRDYESFFRIGKNGDVKFSIHDRDKKEIFETDPFTPEEIKEIDAKAKRTLRSGVVML